MASVVFFHFIPGNSWLHKMNLFPKLLSFILMTSVLFLSPEWAIPILMVGIFVLTFGSGENPFLLCWRSRLYIPFFLFLFFFEMVSPTGHGDFLFWLESGRTLGAIVLVMRYLCALILAHLLLRTSSYRSWRDGLFFLFRPFSVKFADILSLALTMTLHFIPLFMDEAHQILESLKVRSRRIKTPVFSRLRFLGLPLLVQVLLHADQTAMALASRGYTPYQTRVKPQLSAEDFIAMAASVSSLCVMLFLKN